jgi:hypothetical protein
MTLNLDELRRQSKIVLDTEQIALLRPFGIEILRYSGCKFTGGGALSQRCSRG